MIRALFSVSGLALAAVLFSPLTSNPLPIINYSHQAEIVGTWLGTLAVQGTQLRIVFHIAEGEDGALTATMDSPDQGAVGIPVSEVTYAERHLKLVSAAVSGEFDGDLSADGSQIVGEWRQGGFTLPLTLTKTDEGIEGPSRPQEPEDPLPYDAEEVSYPNVVGGNELAGTLTLPRTGGPHPAVVLVSGSGAQDRNETVMGHRPFLVLSDHLTRNGIAVLRFDDRGVGGSTGDFATATSEDFATDVMASINYLMGREDIAHGRIGVVGHSEGALIAPMVAVRSDDVAFIVLMAGPAVTGEEIILEQSALISRASGRSEADIQDALATNERVFEIVTNESDPEVAAGQLEELFRTVVSQMSAEERAQARLADDEAVDTWIQGQVQRVNSNWIRFFLTYDPAPTLARVRVPILAIAGELDLQVPPPQNLPVMRHVLEESGNPDYTVEELPGLNHLFQTATTGLPAEYRTIEETIAPAALQLISDWILERVDG
ncbi:MAG: alpha/beta fold hydrolase [Gemmatimonadales bacterium]